MGPRRDIMSSRGETAVGLGPVSGEPVPLGAATHQRKRLPLSVHDIDESCRSPRIGWPSRRAMGPLQENLAPTYDAGLPSRQSARPRPAQTASRITQKGRPVLMAADWSAVNPPASNKTAATTPSLTAQKTRCQTGGSG